MDRKKKRLGSTLVHPCFFVRTPFFFEMEIFATNDANYPREVLDACARRAGPEELFRVTLNYYSPQVVGMLCEPPFSGAPLNGFTPMVDGELTIINGFCCSFFNNGGMETRYFDIEGLFKIKFLCMSEILRATLQMLSTSSLPPVSQRQDSQARVTFTSQSSGSAKPESPTEEEWVVTKSHVDDWVMDVSP